MTIHVTAEHIAKGRENFKRGDDSIACNCPIALALKDAGFCAVVVSPEGRCRYKLEKDSFDYRTVTLPDICKEFIAKFDLNYDKNIIFESFDFEIKEI